VTSKSKRYYFRSRICWYCCLQKAKVYEQTKFRRHISIDGWDITTSVFKKQTSAILEIYFWFRFRPFARNLRIILHHATDFFSKSKHPLRKYDVISISQDGGRDGWILLPVSYLLTSLPSEGQSLIANQILSRYLKWRLRYIFMAIQNGLRRGQIYFSKLTMCQYPGMFRYILWIQKCIFDACRLSLHNSGLICNQATALHVV